MTAAPSDTVAESLAAWSIVPTVERLRPDLPGLSARYRAAHPYPHIILDDFLPAGIADAMAASFPSPTDARVWNQLPTDDQRGKSSLRHESVLPVSIRRLIHELNSFTMVEFLEELSGISGLISDPQLVGGGIHQTRRGGKLSVHIDYSHHPRYHLFRRMNLILYLTPDWEEGYGGHFELWDTKGTACLARVLPKFNRCVVFTTSAISYHGQPEPLTCPDSVQRNSVALYYYTNETAPLPDDETHATVFKSRPGERAPLATRLVRAASSGWFQDVMPPVVYRTLRRVWNRQR